MSAWKERCLSRNGYLFVVNGLNKKHLQVSKDFFIPGDEILFTIIFFYSNEVVAKPINNAMFIYFTVKSSLILDREP